VTHPVTSDDGCRHFRESGLSLGGLSEGQDGGTYDRKREREAKGCPGAKRDDPDPETIFLQTGLQTETRAYQVLTAHSSARCLPRNGLGELIAHFVNHFLPDLVFEDVVIRCRSEVS
jgi:hypothetical protein